MANDQVIEQLRHIGWRGAVLPNEGKRVARVVAQHRAGYQLHDGNQVFSAQPAGYFLKRGLDPAERPVVGDFVEFKSGQPAQILTVQPRRTILSRAAAGERYERQLIATNIDYVLILMGVDGDFNPARVERYLSLIEGSGAQPVVVLSKADLHQDEVEGCLADLRERLPTQVPIHAINGKDPASAAVLNGYLKTGDSSVLVGSSGAGKSTLTNTLLGTQRMATNEVRQDSRGRHTTTHRALLLLPAGGCLIDTPGMRELKLTGDENLELFADIEELAERCRFADCGHGSEPGCAVQAALDDGELSAERWRNYLKLRDEREEQATMLESRFQRQRGGRPVQKQHAPRGPRERE